MNIQTLISYLIVHTYPVMKETDTELNTIKKQPI
jgi:hypothetical protein